MKTKTMKITIGLTLMVIIAGIANVYSQNDISKDGFIFSGGLGAGQFHQVNSSAAVPEYNGGGVQPNYNVISNYLGSGGAAELNVSYKYNKNLFSARYTGITGLELFSNFSEHVSDFALLYGRTVEKNRFVFSLSGGLSYVNGVKKGFVIPNKNLFAADYEQISYTAIGFPIESKCVFYPKKHIGIGAEYFADINSENSFQGLMLVLAVKTL